MRGTWERTDSGSGGLALVLIIIAAVVFGSGAAAAIDTALVALLIAAAVIAVLVTVALIVFLWHRTRNPSPQGFVRTPLVRSSVVHELPGERPAIGPREVHQHWHFHGVDEDRVAEILRPHAGHDDERR